MKLAYIGLLPLFFALPAAAEEIGRLPTHWFVLPENQANFQEEDSSTQKGLIRYRRSTAAVEKSINRVYASTVSALDESQDLVGSDRRPPDAPADWVPWYLKEIIMDVGVSLQGTLGVLTSKGELAAEVYWQRTDAGRKALGLNESLAEGDQDKVDATFSDDMTVADIKARLQPVVQMVMATGRIQPTAERDVAAQLEKVATQLNEVMTGINAGNTTHWIVDGFRLDVSISGSGMVQPGLSVGAAVRLRFEWKPSSLPQVHFEESEAQRNMRMLLLAIVNDLETVSEEKIAKTGFNLTKLRLGIGGFIQAKFGVAKGKLAANGYVYLKKVATPQSQKAGEMLVGDIPLIDDKVVPQRLAFARRNGVSFAQWTDPESGAEKVAYYMKRDKFRQGLQRAVDMGYVFTVKAAENDGRKWRIYKVKPRFELSLMGVIGLVTIGGNVSLEMEYKRS